MHVLHERPYLDGRHGDRLRHVSYFLSHVTRPHLHHGGLDFVPTHFSEVPLLLEHTTRRPLILAAASLPDRHGFFSLGTNADYVARFVGRWPVFLEANSAMPRTFGHNMVHMSQVVGWTRVDRPLVEVPPALPDALDRAIAERIAERVPDRATIQVGIGSIPNAVLDALGGHRDLGVHTELVSDGIMDLVEAGVITGLFKHRRPNQMVTTFALGSGGQADFAKGAMLSRDGQGFIVLRSTTTDGATSRIVTRLTRGSVVTTLKNTVDKVVTEWGVAELRGRSLEQRARALIGIAHPDFRDQLEREAVNLGYLRR
jgi:acyl-CoA hydrolase